jgi:hypothetical protein
MSETQPVYTPELTRKLKGIVSTIGADWCGIQETINPHQALLLFNSRKSNTTLAIKFDPVDFDYAYAKTAAASRLIESDNDFADRRISVKASTLDRIAKSASEVLAEVEELRRRK